MATLSSVSRHSMGDLTLYIFKFSSLATTDAYAVTNMAGVIDAWIGSYAGTNTLNAAGVSFTNSDTGTTFTIISCVDTTTASVFALGMG